METEIEFINPEELLQSPAFSQIAITRGNGSTIYIGGQNAVTKDKKIKKLLVKYYFNKGN